MSGALADEVFRRRIPPGHERDVLLFYALCAKPDGTEARPTIRTVATVNCISERTAQRIVKRWRERGVLRLLHPGRRLDKDTYLASVYDVDLTIIPWREGLEGRGDTSRTAVAPLARSRGDKSEGRGDTVRHERAPLTSFSTSIKGLRPASKKSQQSHAREPWGSWTPLERWDEKHLKWIRIHLATLDEGNLFSYAASLSAELWRLYAGRGIAPTRPTCEAAIRDVLSQQARLEEADHERAKAVRSAEMAAFASELGVDRLFSGEVKEANAAQVLQKRLAGNEAESKEAAGE